MRRVLSSIEEVRTRHSPFRNRSSRRIEPRRTASLPVVVSPSSLETPPESARQRRESAEYPEDEITDNDGEQKRDDGENEFFSRYTVSVKSRQSELSLHRQQQPQVPKKCLSWGPEETKEMHDVDLAHIPPKRMTKWVEDDMPCLTDSLTTFEEDNNGDCKRSNNKDRSLHGTGRDGSRSVRFENNPEAIKQGSQGLPEKNIPDDRSIIPEEEVDDDLEEFSIMAEVQDLCFDCTYMFRCMWEEVSPNLARRSRRRRICA